MDVRGKPRPVTVVLQPHVPGEAPCPAIEILVPAGRLEKAEALQAERRRRGVESRLLDCLQFSDKGSLALRTPWLTPEALGTSRKATLRALQELQEVRNNLAHGQEFIASGWSRIVVFASNLDALLGTL